MRLAVCILLALHGAIHALGFVKAFGLLPLPQLRALAPAAWPAAALKPLGVLWLLVALTCLAAAAALALGSSAWWQLAAAGIAVSQGLICLAWGDAKAGTLVNLVLLVPVVIAAAEQRFDRESARIVASLASASQAASSDVVQHSELAALPAPVAHWLESSGVVGKPRTAAVHLRQSGALRTSPGGAWLPARAVQDFSIAEPGFVWQVRVRMAHVLPIVGRDSYVSGHGRMLIRLGGVVPLVDAADARIDQGTLLRFLGELVWFPAAALREYVRWEPVDAHSARATLTYAGVSGSALFTFDDQGRVLRVEAKR
ncbi:MAG TPA: DUF6544 family protein, partial [Polyangiales bacterium]|nr:DUF6544 family protein [Polyangiales bacterium]